MGPYVQIGGSLLILAPFVLAQLGRLTPMSVTYLILNLIGSVVLAVDAALGHQWGFLLLEAVWAAVSALSLLRRGRPNSDRNAPGRPDPSTSTAVAPRTEVSQQAGTEDGRL